MLIDVLVPTYRRPDALSRCLIALAGQQRVPDRILVVHRDDDDLTRSVLAEHASDRVTGVVVRSVGAVAAYNAGLDAATGDVVAIIDDDTVPHPDWLANIDRHFAADPRLGGLGGRDIVHQADGIVVGSARTVGRLQWFGRMIGNHHIGSIPLDEVDILKGANMAFRRQAVGNTRFDTRLLGRGAQVHLEVGFCLAIKGKGWRLAYDPGVALDHYPSVRHDADQRSGFSATAQYDRAHNEQLATFEALRWHGRAANLAWALLVGTAEVPGLAQLPRLLGRGDAHAAGRVRASLAGRVAGIGTWWRSRSAKDGARDAG